MTPLTLKERIERLEKSVFPGYKSPQNINTIEDLQERLANSMTARAELEEKVEKLKESLKDTESRFWRMYSQKREEVEHLRHVMRFGNKAK